MTSKELLDEFGFEEEELEVSLFRKEGTSEFSKTGFPKPHNSYRIILETFNQSIEESYFWMLDHLRQTMGYANIDKITDIFSASEHSSFFGAAWQRIGLQQDKVSQFLATIGKMVKELFQLVRELRILDERLSYYEDSYAGTRSSESAEITLKGIWIDMVEQGSKNPASVYGMARELQFITLPDLFFSTHPQTKDEVDHIVDTKIDFNRKVREVLKRKLRSYLEWKRHTHSELKTKRQFTLKYLRQHYDIIRMYIQWVKPYLKNIKRLQLIDRTKSPDLLSTFEGSILEIEILASKLPQELRPHDWPRKNKEVRSCILAHFDFRTRPSMGYQQEGYQKGPLHVGRLEMTLRAYAWTEDEIKKYLDMKEREDFELMFEIDQSLKAAMDALGEELETYLREAGETGLERNKPAPEVKSVAKLPGVLDPFFSVLKGFGEIVTSAWPRRVGGGAPGKKADRYLLEKERPLAEEHAARTMWYLYKDYKRIHGMILWS